MNTQPAVDLNYFAGRIEKLNRRIDEKPRMSWATVYSTSPLRIQIDGQPGPLLGSPKNATSRALIPGERVQVMLQDLRYTVISVSRDDLRGTSAERVALGLSGVMQEGMRFFDTDENRDYVWRNGGWAPHGKLLWSGVWYVNASQIGIFSERISDQPNGAIFCFNEYPGSATNYNWIYHVVPKEHVARSSGQGITFLTSVGGTPTMSRKYIYVADDQFQGQAANASAPNNQHVLREVRSF